MAVQRPVAWQDLFLAAGQSSPENIINVRIIKRCGQPFLVLPAGCQLASQALALYPAQTALARLARFTLATALKLKLPLAPPVFSLPINHEEPFAAFLTQTAGGASFPRLAILSGNPKADGRRFVILLFNQDNQPSTVVKAGIGETAINLIEQEISFLTSTSIPRSTTGTPELRSTFRSNRLHALALDYFPGNSPDPDDAAGLESLLSSWINLDRTISISELPAWQRLTACPGIYPTTWQQLNNGVCHPVIYHGDFTPWNIKVFRGSWQALDWERGELMGVPGWDWFHFVIQSAVLIKRESVNRLTALVEHLLASESFVRYAMRAKIAGKERLLVLAYLVYSIQILKQTEELPRVQLLLSRLYENWSKAGIGSAVENKP